jgi:hypothetical protein
VQPQLGAGAQQLGAAATGAGAQAGAGAAHDGAGAQHDGAGAQHDGAAPQQVGAQPQPHPPLLWWKNAFAELTVEQQNNNAAGIVSHFIVSSPRNTKSCRTNVRNSVSCRTGESASPGRRSSRLTGWQTLLPFRLAEALPVTETTKNARGLVNSGEGSNRMDSQVAVCLKMPAVS